MFKNSRKWDDALDTWGIWNRRTCLKLCTGICSQVRDLPHEEMTDSVFGNPNQLLENAVGAFWLLAWAMGITALIIKVMDKVWPGGIRVISKRRRNRT